MERSLIEVFLTVRDAFPEIKEKVSLLKPCIELQVLSPGISLKIDEFEKILCRQPEVLYRSAEHTYAISTLYRVDDELTGGIIAYQFAEIMAREQNVFELEAIDTICVERGFGEHLLYAFLNDVLPGMMEREFLGRETVDGRIDHLRKLLREE